MSTQSSPWLSLVDTVTGEPPELATRFRVRLDSGSADAPRCLCIEIQATCERLWSPHVDRNAPIYEADALEIFLDPLGGGRIYRELEVAPSGAVFDAWIVNRTELENLNAPRTLHSIFPRLEAGSPRAAVLVDGVAPDQAIRAALGDGMPAARWTACLKVPICPPKPLSILKSQDPSAAGAIPELTAPEDWRLNVFRIQHQGSASSGRASTPVLQAWQPTGRRDFHRPEAFARLPLGAATGSLEHC